MDNYTICIPNTRRLYYTITANIILLTSCICYAVIKYMQYTALQCNSLWGCIILPCTILTLCIVRCYYIVTLRHLQYTNLHFTVLTTLCWVSISMYIPAAILLLLGILEYVVNKDTYIITNAQGILIATTPKKNITWPQIQSAQLKNGYFTIDLHNNTLYQYDLSDTVIPYTEAEYNTYIQQQIHRTV